MPKQPTTESHAQPTVGPSAERVYEYEETLALVHLVDDAADLVRTKGEAAFRELSVQGSRWRHGDTYVFVLDPAGTMLVHADASMEGKNQIDLADVHGKPIVRGLLEAASVPGKESGWYHYQWPTPGGLLPRWKSSYVRLVAAPSGKRYVVGSGVYDERMERAFVVDLVKSAIARMETRGVDAAFTVFRDPKGPFAAKDTRLFVIDFDGHQLVNPGFPFLEGQHTLDLTDAQGKPIVREMIDIAAKRGAGWVDYMWPRAGESIATQKSTYVERAWVADEPVIVACGVYLPGAAVEAHPAPTMSSAELMALVYDAAALLEERGERAYDELRRQGSRWLHDTLYFYVRALDYRTLFHAIDPALVGKYEPQRDVIGRPLAKPAIEIGASTTGEGWVHYMWPEPGKLLPKWKSAFVKRATMPSGEPCLVGTGVYDLKMDEMLIEDLVDRAAALVGALGANAFDELRDPKGPFRFMDTYVYVLLPDGTELVNPAFPTLEGRNLMALEDLGGRKIIEELIDATMRQGSAWVDLLWYRIGDNTPAPKRNFAQRVQCGSETFIVGSGIYVE